MFEKFIIKTQPNIFDLLSSSTEFETITNGRKGAVLVNAINNLIPIVRTTSTYNNPVQKFLPIHYDIIQTIKSITKYDNLYFNNALIEIYDSEYCKMKFHSDQALDLDENSYICLFSCYDNPIDLRKLKIKKKDQTECVDIVLDNNSIVIFPISTNREYLHKIILDSHQNQKQNKWLGITFRLSKTFISFRNECPYFHHRNEVLLMADDIQKKEYYKYRNLENINISYLYPEINYTISISDTLPIKK